MSENLPQKSHFLVYQAGDGTLKIDVRLEDETVWLTQQRMAELFQTSQQNISHHIRAIYEEGELDPAATHKKYLSVRQEGVRQVQRELDYYNLDMIISVGYRVKSNVATRFRQWVPQRLRPQSGEQSRRTEEGRRTEEAEGEAMISPFKLLREFGI